VVPLVLYGNVRWLQLGGRRGREWCFVGQFRGTGVDARVLREEVIRRGGFALITSPGDQGDGGVSVHVG
jgi:hypothetical protein